MQCNDRNQHYDLCPVDSCVNLLSALDSRNGVMSMRTSPHLRALLINNNPCGQQFSWSRFTAVFDAYTGTYNDLCHIICYFRKLQAPRSALVCGATCGMHVFAGFVDKFFGHFRPEIGHGARQSGSRNLYKMLPIYSSSIWHKAFDPPRLADIYNLTKSPTAKSLTGTLQRIRSAPETQLCKVWLKTWKRFYSDGKCPLDGTWCQRNNCQSSYKGEITPEETDR